MRTRGGDGPDVEGGGGGGNDEGEVFPGATFIGLFQFPPRTRIEPLYNQPNVLKVTLNTKPFLMAAVVDLCYWQEVSNVPGKPIVYGMVAKAGVLKKKVPNVAVSVFDFAKYPMTTELEFDDVKTKQFTRPRQDDPPTIIVAR